MKSTRRKLLQIFGVLLLVLTMGVLGYHFIEGWRFFDALYMTVITLATVGYSETHPLSTAGRVFTMFLVFGGMGIILYGITEITAFIIEGEMTGILRRRRMNRTINKMSNHYILCGWGDLGTYVLDELVRTKRRCVVIEKDPAKIRQLLERNSVVVEGDATKDEILEAAGIQRAAGLVAALHTDRDNLFVVITARGLNPRLRIVSKIEDIQSRDKFLRSGASAAVSTPFIGALRLASELIRPETVSFLDTMLRDNSALRVEDVPVGEKSKFIGKPIGEIGVIRETGVLLLSIKRAGDYQFNPSPSVPLQGNDTLVVIGNPDQIRQARTALGSV
jgi:voltage-gated potassium channel